METLFYLDERLGRTGDSLPAQYYYWHHDDDQQQQQQQQELQVLLDDYDRQQQQRQCRQESSSTVTAVPRSLFSDTPHYNTYSTTTTTTMTTAPIQKTPRRSTYSSSSNHSSSSFSLPPLDVFPVEMLRLVATSGFLTPKEMGTFFLFTSKEMTCAMGSNDFVWKSLCCHYWPGIIIITTTMIQDATAAVVEKKQNDSRNTCPIIDKDKDKDIDEDDDYDYQALFYQLLRPAKLRTFDYTTQTNIQKSTTPIFSTNLASQIHSSSSLLDHHESKFSFTITIRGDDTIHNNNNIVLQSHYIQPMELEQLFETGTLSIPNTMTADTWTKCTLRSAYWHVWKKKRKQQQENHHYNRSSSSSSIQVACLNETHIPIWNTERNAYQFLTKYIQLRKDDDGKWLEEYYQSFIDVGFGGLKFQIFVSQEYITLEIRKRHGRHPAGLFRRLRHRCCRHQRTTTQKTMTIHDNDDISIGLVDFLQELAAWDE